MTSQIPVPRVIRPQASNAFAFVGDSRMSQLFNDVGTYPAGLIHMKTNNFFNVANALLGQRLKIAYAGGISGDRSDQYLVNLPAAIASGASWLMIWSVINDVAQAGATGDTALTIWTRIKNASIQALNAGMNVVLPTECGSTSAASSASQMGMIYAFNQYLREFCAVTPGMYCFDIANVVLNPASSPMAFVTNYSTDGTHLNGYGSWYAGVAFAAFIGALIPPIASQIATADEIAAKGNIQQLANPLFITSTGGASNTGITGTTPANFYTKTVGTGTGAISVAADPAGFGNAVTLACNFSAAGDSVYLGQDTTLGNYTIPGDIVESGCEAVVSSGATNLNAVQLYTNFGGTANATTDLYPINTQALPGVAMDLVLRSVPFTLPSGTSWASWQLRVTGSGAGSATVLIRRPWMRRRFGV